MQGLEKMKASEHRIRSELSAIKKTGITKRMKYRLFANES